MNWFDLLLVMILLTGLFWGTWKGLVRQVLSLAGLVLGLLLALNFYSIPAVALNLPPGFAELVGFALIFFSVSLVAMLLSKLTDKLLKAVSLSWLNRLGGGPMAFT